MACNSRHNNRHRNSNSNSNSSRDSSNSRCNMARRAREAEIIIRRPSIRVMHNPRPSSNSSYSDRNHINTLRMVVVDTDRLALVR
jgi:hypothetical protein